MSTANPPSSPAADLVPLGDQVRKLHRTPLILIGPMWRELVEWCRRYLLRPEFPLASPEDIDIPRCVDTAAEAIALLERHHADWTAEQSRVP